jgi:hypothetical protein
MLVFALLSCVLTTDSAREDVLSAAGFFLFSAFRERHFTGGSTTETRTPTKHRAKIAHQRLRMEGWRQRRLGSKEDHSTTKGNYKTDLTLTGLLMEGLCRAGTSLSASLLCQGQERRTMRETEVQTANSRSSACRPLHRED